MSDQFEHEPLDPVERELGERLSRGDEPAVHADDDPALRAAAAWLKGLDDRLAGLERDRSPRPGPAPDPIEVRDAVLARLRPRTERPRTVRDAAAARPSPLPWWRIAAPIAVAAGLAGLFLLRESHDGTIALPAAPSTSESVAPSPLTSSAPADRMQASDVAPTEPTVGGSRTLDAEAPTTRTLAEPHPSALADGASEPIELAEDTTRAKSESTGADALARSVDAVREHDALGTGTAGALGGRIAAPLAAVAEAESLLARLGRGVFEGDALVSVAARLLDLRTQIDDARLVARVDSTLTTLPEPPR